MMFLLWTKLSGAYTDPVGETEGVSSFKTNLKSALEDSLNYNRYQTFFVKLEEGAKQFSRTFAQGGTEFGTVMEKQIFNVMNNLQDLNVEMKDVTEIMSEFAGETGKVPTLQEEMLKNTIALSTVTGIAAKELAKYTAQFAQIGMGQQQAQIYLTKMYKTAQGFGLNASKLTAEVMSNINKANTYQFKGGVQGLTNMVARAQQLGIKFEEIMKTAEKALDPEKAIEMASGMQMLGGNVGALGDPFKLLYMAQNDVEGLQKEFIKVAAASAEFNSETGQFKIGTQQMYRLKQMADELGMDYNELAKAAIRAAKEQKIMSEVGFANGLKEEDKQLLASMAELKDGVYKIQLPGTENWEELSKITDSQIKSFTDAQSEANKTDSEKLSMIDQTLNDMMNNNINSAKDQLSSSEKAAAALQKMANSIIFKRGYDDGAQFADNEYYDTTRITMVGTMTEAVIAKGGEIFTAIAKHVESMNKAMVDYSTPQFIVDLTTIIDTMKTTSMELKDVFKTLKTQITTTDKDDLYVPSNFKGGTILSGSFGQFTLNAKDDFLAAPGIDEYISDAQGAFSILNKISEDENIRKMSPIIENIINPLSEKTKEENPEITTTESPKMISTLQDLLTRNMSLEEMSKSINITNTTTNEVKGDVGVNGEVKLKIEGLNGSLANILESDPNFQRMFKENVMNIVNERLSKSYSEKMGNL
jgi:hypothetical protein